MDEPTHKITVYTASSPLRQPFAVVAGIFADLYRTRELIGTLFRRNLHARFRQSLLGFVWLFIPPIMMAAVWILLFSQRILKVETPYPYPIFVIIGMTVWLSFMGFLNAPLQAMDTGKSVFTKLNVPIETFICAELLRCFTDFLIRSLLLIPIFLWFDFVPPATAWLFPLIALMLFATGASFGMILIPVGNLYHDVSKGLKVVIRFLMYLSPVIYPVASNDGWFATVMKANPLTPAIALSRDVLTTASFEWLHPALVVFGISLAIGFAGLLLLRVARPHLIERMGM